MSKDDDRKDWMTTEEVIASGLPYAPRSRSGVSRLLQRLRYEQPSLVRRAGRGRQTLIHVSAFNEDADPPGRLRAVPVTPALGEAAPSGDQAAEARRLASAIWMLLPPRFDGSPKASLDDVLAAVHLLGYRA